MKRTGWLHIEDVTVKSCHFDESENDKTDPTTTKYSRMWFEYANGSRTKSYTTRNAPSWMLDFYKKGVARGE